jgi:hypothetical protein
MFTQTPHRKSRKTIAQSPARSIADDLSQASGSTTASKRHKLPNHLLRQVVEDIEQTGGIQRFRVIQVKQVLDELLDANTNLYCRRKDPLRTKIYNKVYKWKNLDDQEYEATVLDHFGVSSFNERKAKVKAKQQVDSDEESEVSIAGSSLSSEGTKTPVKRTRPPRDVTFRTDKMPTAPKTTTGATTAAKGTATTKSTTEPPTPTPTTAFNFTSTSIAREDGSGEKPCKLCLPEIQPSYFFF